MREDTKVILVLTLAMLVISFSSMVVLFKFGPVGRAVETVNATFVISSSTTSTSSTSTIAPTTTTSSPSGGSGGRKITTTQSSTVFTTSTSILTGEAEKDTKSTIIAGPEVQMPTARSRVMNLLMLLVIMILIVLIVLELFKVRKHKLIRRRVSILIILTAGYIAGNFVYTGHVTDNITRVIFVDSIEFKILAGIAAILFVTYLKLRSMR